MTVGKEATPPDERKTSTAFSGGVINFKSFASLCTLILLYNVLVGTYYHVESVEDMTCSNSDSESCKIEQDRKDFEEEDGRDFDKQWERIKSTKNKLRKLYIDCVDNPEHSCELWGKSGECDKNPHFMRVHCRKSCGECADYDVDMGEYQNIHGTEAEKVFDIYLKSVLYKKNEIVANPQKHDYAIQEACVNKHELCAFWALIGECTANPGYMKLQCGPSCRSCDLIDINNRCPLDPNAEDVFGPGDLDKMFELASDITGPYKHFDPVVHSHPKTFNRRGKIKYGEDPTYDGPWIVTFESFLDDEESDRLIELGGAKGYERSTDVGAKKADGTYDKHESTSRTSTNAWCIDECFDDPISKRVNAKIENVTGVPDINNENLQLLNYRPGQFYRKHHDFIPHHTKRQCGPRILTFFLYLNDVEAGGATNFPMLLRKKGGLKVFPKKGKAVLWPSVLDSDPNAKDFRTEHEAMDVIEGVKYGANAWIHLRDFKTPNAAGCV